MRLIDVDELPTGRVEWEDIINAPTIDAVPLEQYQSMERTVNKLCKALNERADAVEVVRCKDCKHYNAIDTDRLSECGKGFEVYGDDYCAYGERRADE